MPDWAHFGAHRWGREPALLPAPAVVAPERAHRALTEAAAPFRDGTRFRSLPDVRFRTDGGRLRAPGGLLPAAGDRTADGYLRRLRGELPGTGWLLVAEQPLALDPVLWSAVRDELALLWSRVGWPALPVMAELTMGDRRCVRDEGLALPAEEAVLTWVLSGTLEARLWPEERGEPPPSLGPDTEGVRTFRVRAGQMVYWPAAFRSCEVHDEGCLTLRLRVPAGPRLAAGAVKNLLAGFLETGREKNGGVPVLPFPPPADKDGRVPVASHVEAVAQAVSAVLGGPRPARALRVQWAARRSAAGLEPAPLPRDEAELSAVTFGSRVRRVSEVVRVPDGPGHWVWAVNGHVFRVTGGAGDKVLRGLPRGTVTSVAELCRAVGAPEGGGTVLTLLRALYRLRGIEVTGTAGGPGEEER